MHVVDERKWELQYFSQQGINNQTPFFECIIKKCKNSLSPTMFVRVNRCGLFFDATSHPFKIFFRNKKLPSSIFSRTKPNTNVDGRGKTVRVIRNFNLPVFPMQHDTVIPLARSTGARKAIKSRAVEFSQSCIGLLARNEFSRYRFMTTEPSIVQTCNRANILIRGPKVEESAC
jgi:hypothetical protein